MGKAEFAASLAVSLGLAVAGAAEASSGVQTCARGADVRTIEVLTPGMVGGACDLRYVRDGGTNISVPYHADNSPEFCAVRARTLIRSLQEEGYECAAAPVNEPPELRTGAEAGEDAASLADPPAQAPEEAAAAALAEAVSAPAVAEAWEQFSPPDDPARIESASLPATANHGPAALSVSNASFPARVERRSGSAVGRITGAEPAAPIEPALAAGSAAPAGEEKMETSAATAPSSMKPAQARPRAAEDVIRAVLLAQTAAWNDGDLGAFMTGYWKSDELRFISGTSVSKGWNQTLERYQERYGEDAELGRLSFEGLDVEMISEDIAIVSGRYSHARAGESDLGALTLVMKRFDGLWRIVHEHSTADRAPGEKVESGFSQGRRDH